MNGIDAVHLSTSFWHLGSRNLINHKGLINKLKEFSPDIILCEGESNILSYLKAIYYRNTSHKNTKLIHWSLGGLPGKSISNNNIRGKIKYLLQKQFDAFLVYSSFGKAGLMKLGHPEDKIHVATNVSDTAKHLQAAAGMNLTKSSARCKLGLPDKFTAIYVGAIDSNKRLNILIDAAAELNSHRFNVVIVGDGNELSALKKYAAEKKLANIFFTGRVQNDLALYYLSSNVLVLPGRGGMVISEAMCHALPVVVYQADGTEYDLVQHNKTGVRLKYGTAEEFAVTLNTLAENPELTEKWGQTGKHLIQSCYTPFHMIEAIKSAIFRVHKYDQPAEL